MSHQDQNMELKSQRKVLRERSDTERGKLSAIFFILSKSQLRFRRSETDGM